MLDKFSLTRTQEQNLMEKNMSQLVYLAGKFEHLQTSLLDTKAILSDLPVAGVKPSTIRVILNLHDAFTYATVPTSTAPVTVETISHINLLVQGGGAPEAGQFRDRAIVVPLTDDEYQPPIPDPVETTTAVHSILAADTSTTDRALTLLLWLMRSQLFLDGNKRTALVAANALLFSDNRGLLAIPEDKLHWFNWQLEKFYKNGADASLKQWLYTNALFG
ncbi:Fic family protein [Schleiferilactobacillus shenzhenensis]|uniref:Fido domain-containing protein n=1 Tax=Schleiferilactobacillus shenzhenensis LY-73 TaxID=1231336 RepID=U4TRK6_9LACO|nr:Fic family protein [Schleiferilactobacillus shenzhenensis]ERL64538.1 hypothetical protein L248_0833 [Schleiferilactobacillus shenzhenensis LY-73]